VAREVRARNEAIRAAKGAGSHNDGCVGARHLETVRRRVAWAQRGRRGRKIDAEWINPTPAASRR